MIDIKKTTSLVISLTLMFSAAIVRAEDYIEDSGMNRQEQYNLAIERALDEDSGKAVPKISKNSFTGFAEGRRLYKDGQGDIVIGDGYAGDGGDSEKLIGHARQDQLSPEEIKHLADTAPAAGQGAKAGNTVPFSESIGADKTNLSPPQPVEDSGDWWEFWNADLF